MGASRIAIPLVFAFLPLLAPAQGILHGKAATASTSSSIERVSLRAASIGRADEWTLAMPALPKAAKSLPTGDDKRMRVGVARDATQEGSDAVVAPAWQGTEDGGRATHLRVSSAGALALRVGLRVRGLAAGAELRVASGDRPAATAPVDAATIEASMRAQGVYWTPVTAGAEQLIELWLPRGAAEPSIAVTTLSHLLIAPSQLLKSTGSGTSQSCEENVVCVASVNPALARAANAVAKLLYTENGVSYLCTGTLLSDGDAASQVPYLLTASHCIGSDAAAASLNTFWFFQSSSCNGKDATAYKQLAAGASLLYASSATDVALVRLHDRAPEGAWFAAWDAAPLPLGSPIVTLHHPSGDVKKVSIGQALAPPGAASTNYTTAGWTVGTTEGGSSGSGLFTFNGTEYVLRGALRGGSASCESSGQLDDVANRDYYSRLDLEAPTLAKLLSAGPAPLDDYSGLWWDPGEPGSGMSIVQNADNHVFAAWFTYDSRSQPTWIVMPQAAWKSAVALEGALYRTRGSAFEAPYDASLFSAAPAGTLRLEFNADGSALAVFTIDGQQVAKTLQRQPI